MCVSTNRVSDVFSKKKNSCTLKWNEETLTILILTTSRYVMFKVYPSVLVTYQAHILLHPVKPSVAARHTRRLVDDTCMARDGIGQ